MSLYFGYAWIPLITGLVFLSGLIALLASWAAEGHPRYQPTEGSIVYVSDVGAHLKPLFIGNCTLRYKTNLVAICSISAPGFVLSQAVDRFLRHRGRLAPNHLKREKWMSWLSMVFSFFGSLALILLSVFDVVSKGKLVNLLGL